jgi:hypothetical protein
MCCCYEAEILLSLSPLLDDTRSQFPRLYFVSDEELIEMLAVSRDVDQLLPIARKCFPGISDIIFEVPSSVNSGLAGRTSAALYSLNGEVSRVW